MLLVHHAYIMRKLHQHGSLTSRPASLAVENLDLVPVGTGDLLDVRHGTGHIIEVGLVGLIGSSTLPVGKGVGQDVSDHGVGISVGGEQIIGSAISELVPAVGGTHSDAGELLRDRTDVVVKLRTGQITTVEGLRTDGDGLHDILIAGNGALESGKVLGERGVIGANIALVLGADPSRENMRVSRGSQVCNCLCH